MGRRMLAAVGLASALGIGRPAVGQSKPVLLSIHPRVGDTLRTRFEQIVRATGPANGVASPVPVTRASSMQVVSRSVIERSDALGTIVLAITDSVTFQMPGVDPGTVAAAQQSMRGRRARMRVTPAGGMELLDAVPRAPARRAPAGPDVPRGSAVPLEGDEAFARMPGTLPEGPVAVGTTWTREMALPWSGDGPAPSGGRVEVLFRLDSLRGGGAYAYVSMHGSLARATTVRSGGRVATNGKMEGHLVVDLRRGWMSDSHATFTMNSTFTPAGGMSGKPVQMSLTITQTLRCDP